MGCDYSNKGNLVNRYGQTISYAAGDANTKPLFFMKDQLIKVPYANTAALATAGTMAGYLLVKVSSALDNGTYANVTGTVVKVYGSGNVFYMGVPASVAVGATATQGASEESLAPYKTYVVGTAHGEGTGYPETWKDQPYSTNYGRTQIFKTSCAMTNTARATALRYESSEWARIWKEKLIEHKFDIEQTLLFGSQSEDYMTTQGAVDYINGYGNVFELDTDTKIRWILC